MKKNLALTALIITANFLVYWKTTAFQPVQLDEVHLIDEKWEQFKDKKYVMEVFKRDAFGTHDINFYRPALNLSFMLDARLCRGGFNSGVFHGTNIVIHIIGAILCFFLLAASGYQAGLAAGVSLIFSLHPALAGACGWIPGRNDSMLFCAAAASLLFLIKAARRGSAGFFILHLVFFLAALLIKETAAVLVFVFPVWVFAFAGGSFSGFAKRKVKTASAVLGWAVCLAGYFLLRINAVKGGIGAFPDPVEFIFRTGAYAAYVFAPFNIPVFAVFGDIALNRVVIANAAGLVFLSVLWIFRRGWILPAAAACIYLFILPSAFSDCFQPHRTYMPVFFLALALAEGMKTFYSPRPLITLSALGIAVIVLAAGAKNFSGRFADPEAFWGDSFKHSPSCSEAAWIMGYTAHLRGDTASAENYYLKTIALNPFVPDARNNLGIIYKSRGQYNKAWRFYEGELKLNPQNAKVLENIGNLMMTAGDWNRAVDYYKRKIALDPGAAKTYESLIFCLKKAGRGKEADNYEQKINRKERKADAKEAEKY